MRPTVLARDLALATIAAGSLFLGQAASAQKFEIGSISVERPWSRATPGGAQVAAGYFTVRNGSSAPDRLLSATAEIAGRTEIHQMTMVDGMMKMRQLSDGVPIPAGGSVTLKPGSYHLMFKDLKGPLKEGETFAGTLSFEKAGTLDVTFSVEGRGASDSDGHHDH